MKHSLILLFLFISTFLTAQTSQNEIIGTPVHAGLSYGQVWPHSHRIKDISPSTTELHLKFYRPFRSNSFWENTYHKTQFGFSADIIRINSEILGTLIGSTFFIEPTFYKRNRFCVYGHLGLGFAVATKLYNSDVNSPQHRNLFISKNPNIFLRLGLYADYIINNNWSIGINGTGAHASNASMFLPNLGVNIFSFGVHANYKLAYHQRRTEMNASYNKDFRPVKPFFGMSFGLRNTNEEINKYYKTFSAIGGIRKCITNKNLLEANIELIHRQGRIFDKEYTTDYHQRIGIAGGHEFMVSHFGFVSQLGIYLYDSGQENHNWFAKIGARYYFTHNLFMGIVLLNQKQTADYLQYSLNYAW